MAIVLAGLALGLAEGTILFKFTVPIHMPLMLFAIVRLHRRAYSAAPVPEASVEQAGFWVTMGFRRELCEPPRCKRLHHQMTVKEEPSRLW